MGLPAVRGKGAWGCAGSLSLGVEVDGVSSGAGRLHGGPERGRVCLGFGCLEGLAVHCFGNAESSVLSAWLMRLQTVCCRVPRGQGEVKCFPPIEQFQERAAAATVAGGRLGRSAWPARMERKGREETERRNEKLSACSPEERQALVVPPVTLG